MEVGNARSVLERAVRRALGGGPARGGGHSADGDQVLARTRQHHQESQQYLRDFTRIAAEESIAAGIVARMTERYPDWANLRTLWHSARTAISRKSA